MPGKGSPLRSDGGRLRDVCQAAHTEAQPSLRLLSAAVCPHQRFIQDEVVTYSNAFLKKSQGGYCTFYRKLCYDTKARCYRCGPEPELLRLGFDGAGFCFPDHAQVFVSESREVSQARP